MSEDNSQNAKSEPERNPSENENKHDTNKCPGVESSIKTHALLPAIKNITQNKETIIDVINITNQETKIQNNKITDVKVPDGNNHEKNEYLVYNQYQTQIRPPKTTWVMFQGGAALPPGETPLSYDPSSRNDFVRLVFGIVLLMLMITASFVAMVLFTDLKDVFRTYGLIIALPAMVLMIALTYIVSCSPCARVFPSNIVLLVLAVIGMSLITAYITSRYRTEIVLFALLATIVVVIVCIILACTSFDFTQFLLYVIVISAAFGAVAMIAGLYMMISGVYMKWLHLGILLVGTCLNVIILIMELQTILGGRAVEMGEDDYALGAFLLYTSILDIFLKLVQILGILDN